nr:hypothetical protein [Streptosporangium amethystogenes]
MTATPFGRPVDPDVYITYANDAGSTTDTPGALSGTAASRIAITASSTATNRPRPAGNPSNRPRPAGNPSKTSSVVNVNTAPPPADTPPPPSTPPRSAFHTPKIPTIMSTPRGNANPTTDSAPTP